MVKKTQPLHWEPVKLDGALVNGDIDGLIGVEECTDYNLHTIHSGKKGNKRKLKLDSKFSNETSVCKKSRTSAKQSTHSLDKLRKSLSPSKRGSTGNDFIITEDNSSKTVDENEELDEVKDVHGWEGYGLSKSLLRAIREQNFEQPTEIQALTLLPAILGRRDILGAAETGSGKTLAFGLPIITGILKIKETEEDKIHSDDTNEELDVFDAEENSDSNEIKCVKVLNDIDLDGEKSRRPLYALILTPTRELAIQIKNHLVAVTKYTGIHVAVVVGGMAMVKQERILRKCPEIVVATPGRLWELIQEGNPHLSQLDELRFLAIDETDRMMERGHFQELHSLLERLNANKFKQKRRQNFVFSATLTLIHELPRHLILKKKMRAKNSKKIAVMSIEEKLQQIINLLGITNPKIVDITKKTGTASTLTECRITCGIEEKDFYIYYFLQKHPGRTLIFCNSIGCVKRLTTLLSLLNCKPLALHASMQQRQRLKNLDNFRNNKNAILVATDVAARGLDIPLVEHVLHYQTPRTTESYVHRSGRTARASQSGITVLLVDPSEMQNYLKLCRTLGRTEDLPHFPVQQQILSVVKERVKLARSLDKLELKVRKTNSEKGWLQKAAEEMDIVLDDEISVKCDVEESSSLKKLSDIKRKQLAQMLMQPLFPKGFSGKYPLVSAELGMSLEITKQEQQQQEKAIDVLKNSMENASNGIRKKAKWLFKPKASTNINNGDKIVKSQKGASKHKRVKPRTK